MNLKPAKLQEDLDKEVQTQCPTCHCNLMDKDYSFNGKRHCCCECMEIAMIKFTCEAVIKCKRITSYHQGLRDMSRIVLGLCNGAEPEEVLEELGLK